MKRNRSHFKLNWKIYVASAFAGALAIWFIAYCREFYAFSDASIRPFAADVWGTVSDWAMVVVTVITAVAIWRTLNSQRKTQSFHALQISMLIEDHAIRYAPSVRIVKAVISRKPNYSHDDHDYFNITVVLNIEGYEPENVYLKENDELNGTLNINENGSVTISHEVSKLDIYPIKDGNYFLRLVIVNFALYRLEYKIQVKYWIRENALNAKADVDSGPFIVGRSKTIKKQLRRLIDDQQ